MNWKEFLKPTRWKIVLAIFIFLLNSVLLILINIYLVSTILENFRISNLVRYPSLILIFLLNPSIVYFGFVSRSFVESVSGIVINIFYWYILSCLIIWIYDKLKKKK